MSMSLLYWEPWIQYCSCVSPVLTRGAGSFHWFAGDALQGSPGGCWPALLQGHVTGVSRLQALESPGDALSRPSQNLSKMRWVTLHWLLQSPVYLGTRLCNVSINIHKRNQLMHKSCTAPTVFHCQLMHDKQGKNLLWKMMLLLNNMTQNEYKVLA